MTADKFVTKAELQAQLELALKEKSELATKLEREQSRKGTQSGWRLYCPNKEYAGKVVGVLFTDGEAFVEDLDEPINGMPRVKVVELLHNDFGYEYEYVENGKSVEPKQAEKEKSLIETISIPTVVK